MLNTRYYHFDPEVARKSLCYAIHAGMNSVTQEMKYRQSLIRYAEKFGVSRASRKYNKSRSYIYFWKARYNGILESLACLSRRLYSNPNQHTEEELKLIRDMRRRNPELGMIELWHRLRQRGYQRCPESLFRVMQHLGMFPPALSGCLPGTEYVLFRRFPEKSG